MCETKRIGMTCDNCGHVNGSNDMIIGANANFVLVCNKCDAELPEVDGPPTVDQIEAAMRYINARRSANSRDDYDNGSMGTNGAAR